MELSKRRRKWISIFVGVVGLVTVVGLSDLIFVIPQQSIQQSVETTTVVSQPTVISSSTVNSEIINSVTPEASSTSSSSSKNEFGL